MKVTLTSVFEVFVIIDSRNGLAPDQHQANSWIYGDVHVQKPGPAKSLLLKVFQCLRSG